ncbi:MAG TPA: hypothetical protein VGE51_00150 [Fontimonas sp.]
MRPNRSAATSAIQSGSHVFPLATLALSLLPAGAALADEAAQAGAASASLLDAKTAILVLITVAVAWGLRVVLRQYAQGDNKPKLSKRERLQPNL